MRLLAITLLLFVVPLLSQADNLLEQADAAFREGDVERARALARRVLARSPSQVHAHMILGVIAAQKNDWQVSNRHFLAVVRADPANPFGYFYLGQAKLYEHQWEAAIRYFSSALERRYPDEDRLRVELALAQEEAGRPKDAVSTLARVAVPSDQRLAAQYHAVSAFASAKLDQPVAALEAIRRSLEIDDSNSQTWEFLISTLITTDQAPQALAEAIIAQKRFPDNPDIQFLFALASYYVSESPLSKLALRNLRESDPASPRVLLAEGLLHRRQGDIEQAEAAFKRAAERGVRDAHLLLGIVYSEGGDTRQAEREYREAERLDTRNGQVMLELGKLLATQGALEQARVRLEKAVQFMPASPGAHYQLGLVYRRMGDTENAQRQLQIWKEISSKQTAGTPEP